MHCCRIPRHRPTQPMIAYSAALWEWYYDYPVYNEKFKSSAYGIDIILI